MKQSRQIRKHRANLDLIDAPLPHLSGSLDVKLVLVWQTELSLQ